MNSEQAMSERRSWRQWRPTAAVAALSLGVVASLVIAGCGKSSPTTPSYSETWSGALDDRALGGGTLRVTWVGTAQQQGTWSASIAGFTPSGSVTQLLVPSGGDTRRLLTFSCGPAPDGGSLVFTGTATGNTIQGTYFTAGCGTLSTGSLQLATQ